MAEITAALVKELREKTGAGMMDCKKALQETAGDAQAAIGQLSRVTRPGGVVLVSMLNPANPYRLTEWFLYWPALRVFSGRGQPAAAQLIGPYGIQCRPVRDLLVDYLAERQPSLDFSSLNNLAYHLGKLFWRDLETHHPGISSLKLPRDVAAAWKQRVMTRTTTALTPQGQPVQAAQPRLNGRSILTTVRAFYLDLAEWAEDDPSRWGPWVVRCPVTATDASHKRTGPGASPAWISGPGNACRCCPPWPPSPAASSRRPPSCSAPRRPRPRQGCSPPPRRPCDGR